MSKVIKCKVIVIGDSNVGKTSIINTIINEKTVSQKTTIEISSVTKEMKIANQKFKFEIWDTIGQERYHSVNRMFYLDSKICIIVYDITNKTSYENAIGKWLNDIQKFNNRDLIIGLAGNKCDLYDQEKVNEHEARNFCNQYDIIFGLTSVYNNIGIEELFNNLSKKFYDNYKNGIYGDLIENISLSSEKMSNSSLKETKKKKFCCN